MFAKIGAIGATAFVAAFNTHAAPGQTAIVQVSAVEYYYAPLDYYFLTSRDTDKSLLDGAVGWQRTGKTINGVPD